MGDARGEKIDGQCACVADTISFTNIPSLVMVVVVVCCVVLCVVFSVSE